MSNKLHSREEIVAKLRQVEVLVGQGKARIDAIREVSVTEGAVGSCEGSIRLVRMAVDLKREARDVGSPRAQSRGWDLYGKTARYSLNVNEA